MPTAIRGVTRIQDCDDYGDALSWAGGVVFNEAGADVDFRVEGVGQANALFVQGSDGNVGIGTATPGAELDVYGTSSPTVQIHNPTWGTDETTELVFRHSTVNDSKIYGYVPGGGIVDIRLATWDGSATTDVMTFKGSGNVGIGTTSPDRRLHAEVSDAVTNATTYGLRLSHITSGTAAAYFGTGIEFELEDAGGGMNVAAAMEVHWLDATAGQERASLKYYVRHSGGIAEAFRASGIGAAIGIGYFGSVQVQQAHIADAANAAGDPPTQAEFNALVAKFNTLLADLEGYGLLASA